MGPDEKDCLETGRLVDLFIKYWGNGIEWVNQYDGGPHEANYLKLDSSRLKSRLGWTPRWDTETAVKKTVEWSKAWINNESVRECMDKQIKEFITG